MREEERKKCQTQGEQTLVPQLAYAQVTSMDKVSILKNVPLSL